MFGKLFKKKDKETREEDIPLNVVEVEAEAETVAEPVLEVAKAAIEPGYIADWVSHHALVTPDKTALIDLASSRKFSYAEFDQRVGKLAGYLQSIGIKRGDRVGFYLFNSTDIMEIVFACWRIGAVSLALNFRLTAKELEYIVNDSQPEAIIYDAELAEIAGELAQLTNVNHWILSDCMGADTAYEQAIAGGDYIADQVPTDLQDLALIMYSSGTTGRPKGVEIRHEMILFSCMNAMGRAKLGPEVVNFTVMPLFHIGGFQVFAAPSIYFGGTSVIMRHFDPGAALDVFNNRSLGVTHFIGVPAIYNALKAHPKNAETDFSGIKCALAGAEAVPVPLVKWWYERGLVVQEGYGMTESTASNCMVAYEDIPHKLGSAGRALMHTQMKVMKDDTTEAAIGELGELWMRGPAIVKRYWNRPDANEESFHDGWFKSGDIVRMDEDGYYYIEDRSKDMYISGGENVYPAEIENILYGMDEIVEVAVIGVPDEQWGETGCAVVVLKEGASLTIKDIINYLENEVAKYKLPKYMHEMDELPRNATGKVLKYQLRESVPEILGLKD